MFLKIERFSKLNSLTLDVRGKSILKWTSVHICSSWCMQVSILVYVSIELGRNQDRRE